MEKYGESFLSSENAARAKLEELLWPNDPVCPHCSGIDRIYNLGDLRRGLKKCGRCRRQFTIRTGTILQASHVPLVKWLQAIVLGAQDRECNAGQLARTLDISLTAAQLMARRLKQALRVAKVNFPDSSLDPEEIVSAIVRAPSKRGLPKRPRRKGR